ncbi:hypothetical protein [Arenibacter sp. F20364]|uniref:hypothetical protein n=1 Tax=Arenibacter sp. F20364 TaxID=2926415 RepID=UPI001FF2AFFC|nr:hypothetical protein [Arenibacter sp. F20364]MCK0192975.1 hypothetical protein [Arenibacter sp. F20364]
MKIEDFTLPEFVFGEFPIKDDSFNDQRQFIFHKGISLIEVIAHDEFINVVFEDKTSKQYSYFEEDFTLVYHTNNTEYCIHNEMQVLDLAWEWYRKYLLWEDIQ